MDSQVVTMYTNSNLCPKSLIVGTLIANRKGKQVMGINMHVVFGP